MRDPHNWSWVVVILVIATGLFLTTISCGNDDDDDEEDDDVSYGMDIEGIYTARIITTIDTCDENNVGTSEEWFLEIEQTDDLAAATVLRRQVGAGTEEEEFFQAEVFGSSIVLLETEKTNIGDTDCLQVKLKHYRLTVSGEDSVPTEVSGRLYDEVFYLGASCDSSTQDCQMERIVESIDLDADDDTADAVDDDTA